VKKNLIVVGTIVVLILFLDQLLKVYIKTNFMPGEVRPLIGNWFLLDYIENPGMAFGTTFGSSMWHKLALSIFRVFAIIGICYYWLQQARKGVNREFLIAVGLILAGATGNLIDSMFYDFVFKYDPCIGYNHLAGSGIKTDCGFFGTIETRHTGFLLGNVVDMFKFQAYWPQWMPWIGGGEVFPAIWNLADFSISTGIVLIFIRQKKYFPKESKGSKNELEVEQDQTQEI
jgi:signal peptidase II